MHLQLTLAGAPTATVRIARVEVASAGQALGVLTADQPTKWQGGDGQYTPWDGALAADAPSIVSYKLSTASLPAGATQLGASYQLSVTVEAVLLDGTVLRAADTYLHEIAPEPHVVT